MLSQFISGIMVNKNRKDKTLFLKKDKTTSEENSSYYRASRQIGSEDRKAPKRGPIWKNF